MRLKYFSTTTLTEIEGLSKINMDGNIKAYQTTNK